ncbi:MAG TPA: RNA polymerase sigma factor [Gammaproteobacteria bacterium]|nr:RNA polymerase sigma factor [Gammaproteobacteria bacterium]
MTSRIPQADPAVLAQAQDGDRSAHARLYETFAPMVYTLARRILASTALAEDVLQETFVEVLRNVATCRGPLEFGPWVRRIAVNRCLMHLRSPWVARRASTDPPETATASLDGRAADEQMMLERALAALSVTARAVVWLHDIEGYTHEEIGRLMGRTPSFSKSQLARAHDRLRELLEGERPEGAKTELCASILKIS